LALGALLEFVLPALHVLILRLSIKCIMLLIILQKCIVISGL
jgi:hypothetical protein